MTGINGGGRSWRIVPVVASGPCAAPFGCGTAQDEGITFSPSQAGPQVGERTRQATRRVERQPQSVVPASISGPTRAETKAVQPFVIIARELGHEHGIKLARD